jgi:lipoyl(octanoyl) transferase
MDNTRQELWVCQLGTVPYAHAVAIQEQLRDRRLAGELPDVLLLLEHPPVFTRGRRSQAGELLHDEAFYRRRGIEVLATDRGGRITYHGPGQLVGYPIMHVTDVDAYLRTMEEALIAVLAEEGVQARSRHDEGIDYTGVWVQERKIASIGVHLSRGVTTHGFALNVEVDLAPFSWVVACGLHDVAMTSLAREQAPAPATGMACVRRRVAYRFAEAHGLRQRLVTPARLGIAADTAPAAETAARTVAVDPGGGPGGPEPLPTPREPVPTGVPA